MKFRYPVTRLYTGIVLCCLFAINSFSQKQTAIWYFGYRAGLDFNANPVTALTNGAISPPVGQIEGEGTAVISDTEGNLLFYTDGVTVFNRLHEVMPNGTNLWGDYSTTQTLIAPQPGNDSIFYIFTASPQYNAVFAMDSVGFHYSVVNLNHDNGYGDIVSKNILLYKFTSEKMSAVHHRNGQDIWVVMHEWGSNCFRSYLVTSNGIDLHPVISCIGSVHIGGGPMPNDNYNAVGQMKISPDGSLLALVLAESKNVEVFFFDDQTGRVTAHIATFSAPVDFPLGEYYGIEFSANGKYLYFSLSYWNAGCGVNIAEYPSQVWQYAIEKNKLTKVGEFVGTFYALQLALDGKIYISRCNDITNESDYLAVIKNPNREGTACNFISQGVSLNGRKNSFGLPNFIASYFRFEEPVIDMPNVFTPNGDNYNPVFKPMVFNHMLEADLKIINRWGQEVYYTRDAQQGWDGGNSPSGVYYWLLRYWGKSGTSGTLRGWVHLIR